MNYIDHAIEGLRNLYFSKLRSLLALLGVLVGSASVVAMVMGGQLAANEALKQFKSLGTDLLAVTINAASNDDNLDTNDNNLTVQQAFDLVKTHQSILQGAPYTQIFHTVYYNGVAINGMILGVTDSFADIVNIKLRIGRFVSLLDQYQFYCVVGHNIYEQMKEISHDNPIGQQIQIGDHIFVVVGVAESWAENSFVYANLNETFMIPIMAATVINNNAVINNIILKLKQNADISQVEKSIINAINYLLPDKQVSFRSPKELIAKMEKQSDILTVFLGLIGCVSLIVGGIGVMNIMLVSVVERKREIGIRLAVGAKRFDIAALFLIEAIMLSLVGGVFGVLIGIVIAYIMTFIWNWEFVLYLWPPLAGFSVSAAVGIFFGWYPAYLASKLEPIDALKME